MVSIFPWEKFHDEVLFILRPGVGHVARYAVKRE